MGEPKFLTTSSETLWDSSSLYFEPWASRDLSLERVSTLGEGSISLRGIRWVVERPRSYLGRSMERHRRVVRSTLWWTFFHFFVYRLPCAKNRREAFPRPSEASWSLPKAFLEFVREKSKFSFFHIFSWKFNMKYFFSRGEPKFLTTLSETLSEKRQLHFETVPSRGLR